MEAKRAIKEIIRIKKADKRSIEIEKASRGKGEVKAVKVNEL